MAEFLVKPEDYLEGGRLYNQPDIVVVSPPGVDTVEDKATGINYFPGSRAITVTKTTGGYAGLPQEVKDILGGSETGYNPFKDITGYAFDPVTGQFIVQNSPGNFGFLGAKFKKDPTGAIVYDSEATENVATANASATATGTTSTKKVVSTYADPATGDVTAVYEDGTTGILARSGAKQAAAQSAYDLLYQQFNDMGIGSLVEPLKNLIIEGVSPAEFTLRLRQTDQYKKRFAANAQRIAKGLRAISEAEYIGLEDQYQDIMRRYGLPESYYAKGELGTQQGFEQLIANDVSNVELEDRVMTAQKRVLTANPEVSQALKAFYPGITNSDILAYTLDPKNAIEDIKRKVTAAEIGGAAVRAGLGTSVSDAEYLQRYGVTKEQADQGYQTISQVLPRASELSSIYSRQGVTPYTQATAEQEVFNLPGQVEAQKQRKKLTALETATFSQKAGAAQGALSRERAGNF